MLPRTIEKLEKPCKQGLADRWRKSSGTSGHNIVVDPLRSHDQKSDSKKLWRTVSTVLGKSAGKSTSPSFTPAEFLSFLELKVETIRSATASAPPPTFTRTDSNLDSFDICQPDEISRIIKASAAKSCDLDPAPTFLVKECLDVLLPHLTRLCNVSIQSGCLPLSQKTAMVMPRLKKSGLDPAEIKNYRPISNLPFMSKVIEKLILSQLTRYLTANGLFPKFQSGFRRYHSTETAVLRVLSDIYSAIDQDQVSLLALLDVSAAFDTVDHGILLERLSTSYGLSGMAYTWLESYITGREHIIHVGNRHTPPSKVLYGVPQGSVLGPVLYVLYTSDVARLVEALGLGAHLYADDTQLYGHCSPANSYELASRVLRAIDSIHEWMSSNRLSLNTGKTQFIWLGTKHSLAKRETDRLHSLLPSLTELTSVRNLGFIIDQELNMKDHITKLCQSCYYQLRQIRTVRHSLTSSAIQTLVHAFICTRVDFSNSLLYGTSAYLLDRLQSVLNSAARLILRIGKYDPISAAIRRDLHWLPVPFRIRYKLNSITSNCLAGRAPEYLIELCHSVTDIPARRNLRSSSRVQLLVPRYRKERSGKRGYSVSSPQLWNLLPVDIRLLHNDHQLFRKRLKTHYMQQSMLCH